ncbi:DNA polymerase III subunit beta [Shimazuella sp. AN120528]|uniref:DNA polymerase III subunit beta n=1 Tax=Shimazuella soli TaxID=1892854 RepID=UPI001F0EF596|nr:DNA polymerase III subunit beta [Shimazuella soli]MCH5585035.1 DNA polymerase III subunit beta [Shimazuella soli]
MKLRILQSVLVEAVSQVTKAVSTRTTIPILTGIKVTAEDDQLTLTGSNSDLTIETKIPKIKEEKEQLFVEESGSVVVPGKIFAEIVRKLPGNEVEWIVGERNNITIRSGKAEFQLHGLPSEEYPSLPQLYEEQVFSLSADLLRTLVRKTSFAVAVNEARGVFTGVLFQLEDGLLTCVATDSHRLSRQRAQVESLPELHLKNVIIPGKSMSELAKTFADETELVDLVVAGNQLLARNQYLSFYTRLLEGSYPDTNRVIPQSGDVKVTTKTKELLQSVERASLISRDGRDNVIKWTVSDDQVQITSASQEIGSVVEEIKAEVKGHPLTISFNARYMIEALRTIDSEEIHIQFTGSMTPFLIQPTDRNDSLHLIVPIRTR